jgi:CO dehydrogenase/acetyl-CoA synthase beta subunit
VRSEQASLLVQWSEEEEEQEEENEYVTYAYNKISSEQSKSINMEPIQRRFSTAAFNEFDITRKKENRKVHEIVISQERQNSNCYIFFTDY